MREEFWGKPFQQTLDPNPRKKQQESNYKTKKKTAKEEEEEGKQQKQQRQNNERRNRLSKLSPLRDPTQGSRADLPVAFAPCRGGAGPGVVVWLGDRGFGLRRKQAEKQQECFLFGFGDVFSGADFCLLLEERKFFPSKIQI